MFRFLKRFSTISFTLYLIFREQKKEKKGIITKHQFGKFLRAKLEGLGPTFIKVGQILSLRPDLVPIEYCTELRGLLDQTEQVPLNEILRILKKELGQNPDKIFSHIGKSPIASASLAQVHKAKLKNSDEYIALKIKKPKVEWLIKMDIKIISILNSMFYPLIKERINSRSLIENLNGILNKELNFIKEGVNIEKFKEEFSSIKYIKTPLVYWQYTTTNLLVMEYIPGITLNKFFDKIDSNPKLKNENIIDIDGIQIDKIKLAHRLIHITAFSVFKTGFFMQIHTRQI